VVVLFRFCCRCFFGCVAWSFRSFLPPGPLPSFSLAVVPRLLALCLLRRPFLSLLLPGPLPSFSPHLSRHPSGDQ
jgi:hypothetical protein